MTSDEYAGYFAIIRTIPEGRVMTYGDVAKAAANPRGAQSVGRALSSLDDKTIVPWWRVISAEGRIIVGKGRGHAADRQRHLLEAEGVYFDLEGAIDLKTYRFTPRGARADSV